MDLHTKSFNKSRGCARSSQHRKTLKHQPKSNRWFCVFPTCKSTFTREHDLVRHQKTVHGPKRACKWFSCGYSTARNDKMNEHVRKRHFREQDYAVASYGNEHIGDNFGQFGITSEESYDQAAPIVNDWTTFDVETLPTSTFEKSPTSTSETSPTSTIDTWSNTGLINDITTPLGCLWQNGFNLDSSHYYDYDSTVRVTDSPPNGVFTTFHSCTGLKTPFPSMMNYEIRKVLSHEQQSVLFECWKCQGRSF